MLEKVSALRYIGFMSKNTPNTTLTTVRDSKSGRFVTVKGAGALKGKMTISKKVDLTKPILASGPSGKWPPKASSVEHSKAKH